MNASAHLTLGVVLALAGAVLALGLPDVEVLWFRGRTLGFLLMVLGT